MCPSSKKNKRTTRSASPAASASASRLMNARALTPSPRPGCLRAALALRAPHATWMETPETARRPAAASTSSQTPSSAAASGGPLRPRARTPRRCPPPGATRSPPRGSPPRPPPRRRRRPAGASVRARPPGPRGCARRALPAAAEEADAEAIGVEEERASPVGFHLSSEIESSCAEAGASSPACSTCNARPVGAEGEDGVRQVPRDAGHVGLLDQEGVEEERLAVPHTQRGMLCCASRYARPPTTRQPHPPWLRLVWVHQRGTVTRTCAS